MSMNYIFLILFLPATFASSYDDLKVESQNDCWPQQKSFTVDTTFGVLIKFSSRVPLGQENCSVQLKNPWLPHIQNGFGLFLSREMDCASTLIVDCLPDSITINQSKPMPVPFTCHSSENKVTMPCHSISLTVNRNNKMPAGKKLTLVQVVALAKEPCDDDQLFFQCPNDYPGSCIDRKFKCNGRSECPTGDDELSCHLGAPSGISIFVFLLMILAFLFLICVFSAVCIICCCRAACNRMIRRFRSLEKNKQAEKKNANISGEDAILMSELAARNEDAPVPKSSEPTPLVVDSTKPIYPRLE